MNNLLKSEFTTKNGDPGIVLTRKRKDGLFVTTFNPQIGLEFHSVDADPKICHDTVLNFLRDVKGCFIKGDDLNREPPPPKKKRFIL
ncbi:MAG: hypothetical protein ACD_79C01418G0001 [uncultured bacterium]|nr:MAG: hypothetical protein ACD_79C01418G0001 [uncultured bacterium]